jgi:hypothetical protein
LWHPFFDYTSKTYYVDADDEQAHGGDDHTNNCIERETDLALAIPQWFLSLLY